MNDKKPIIGTMRLGSWGRNYSSAEVYDFLKGCADMGLTDIDLADIYGGYTTNALIGKALSHDKGLRSQLNLIAKIGIRGRDIPGNGIHYYDSSSECLTRAFDASLKNLGVDNVDMVMIHRFDYLTKAGDLAQTLSRFMSEGKALRVGVSNYAPTRLRAISQHVHIAANQISLSLNDMSALDDGSLDIAADYGTEIMAWSPLGGGMLLGQAENTKRLHEAAPPISAKYGLNSAQLYLAWVAAIPNVHPVLGTASLPHVKEAITACQTQLDPADWYALLAAAREFDVP